MKFFRPHPRRSDGPEHPIIRQRRSRNPRYRVRRMLILGTVVVTLLFIAKIFLGFFDFEHVHVSIALERNAHYKEGDIYDVLGDNLHNIITDSEAKTVSYLKDNLSYVKYAQVSKHFVKRQLSIEITERVPFARLKHILSTQKKPKNIDNENTHQYYLIDEAGYVLESITREKNTHLTLILDEGRNEPVIGKQIKTGTTQRGLQILKLIMFKKPELRKHLNSIDARVSDMITLNIGVLPMPAWISSDMIETGLHHIGLFIEQQGLHILQREKQRVKGNISMKQSSGNKVFTVPDTITYIDARYEDSLFLGGESR